MTRIRNRIPKKSILCVQIELSCVEMIPEYRRCPLSFVDDVKRMEVKFQIEPIRGRAEIREVETDSDEADRESKAKKGPQFA